MTTPARDTLYSVLMLGGIHGRGHSPERSEKASELIDAYRDEALSEIHAELAAARERIAELTMTPRERANLRVQALVNAGDYEGACAAAEAFEASQTTQGV